MITSKDEGNLNQSNRVWLIQAIRAMVSMPLLTSSHLQTLWFWPYHFAYQSDPITLVIPLSHTSLPPPEYADDDCMSKKGDSDSEKHSVHPTKKAQHLQHQLHIYLVPHFGFKFL